MKKGILITTLAASLVLAALGARMGMLVASQPNPLEGLGFACEFLMADLLARPLAFEASYAAFSGALAGFLSAWCFWAALLAQSRRYRAGEEHGTSRWGTRREGRAFLDRQNPLNNIIFSRGFGMAISRERFDPKLYRNLNTLILGGSGSGKTRGYVIPNILQANTNFLITDPKGSILPEVGYFLEREGYEIKVLDTIEWQKSLCFNPLAYVRTDAEVESFVNCLCENLTPGKTDRGGDPIWSEGEKMLYTTFILLLRDWFDPADYHLGSLLYLLGLAMVKESDEDFRSPLDLLFEQIETGYTYRHAETSDATSYAERARSLRPRSGGGRWEKVPSQLIHNRTRVSPALVGGCPNDSAVRHYRKFKQAAGRTLKSFLITCNAHLNRLDNDELLRLLAGAPNTQGAPTGKCELELDQLGDQGRKIALFGIVSDTDPAFHFIFALLMWQAVNLLCNKALTLEGNRLPTPVHMILDEFANIGTLPNFNKVISVTRSRNIFLSLILQSIPQLSINYGEDEAEVIRNNCDTMLFLGGTNAESNEEISKRIGDQTIDVMTSNQSRGHTPSYTKNHQRQGRRLIDPSEIERLGMDQEIVLISHARPLLDHKFALEKHPNYRYTASALRAEPFDYLAYLKRMERR